MENKELLRIQDSQLELMLGLEDNTSKCYEVIESLKYDKSVKAWCLIRKANKLIKKNEEIYNRAKKTFEKIECIIG